MRKLIENILHEEMGVPSNIVEAAKLITENIYYELKKIFSGTILREEHKTVSAV